MGKVLTKLFGKKPVKVLITGLDAAGKTTTLYQMKLGEVVQTIPTIGFNVEALQHKNLNITMWEGEIIRPLMRHYFPNTDALVFIVDSTDKERMNEVKEELHGARSGFLHEDDLWGVPLLVLANKQDSENVMSLDFIKEGLELHKLRSRDWAIFPTCAKTGDGLHEAFDWLSDIISYGKATETVKSIGASATQTVTDNKTVTKTDGTTPRAA